MSSKFGMDEACIEKALAVIGDEREHLALCGLHCHLGSTIDDIEIIG